MQRICILSKRAKSPDKAKSRRVWPIATRTLQPLQGLQCDFDITLQSASCRQTLQLLFSRLCSHGVNVFYVEDQESSPEGAASRFLACCVQDSESCPHHFPHNFSHLVLATAVHHQASRRVRVIYAILAKLAITNSSPSSVIIYA